MNSVTKQFLTDIKNRWTKTILTDRKMEIYTKRINVEMGQTDGQTKLKTIPWETQDREAA